MEALRPLWEDPQGEKAQKMQDEGTVSFHAFSEDEQMNADFSLSLNGQESGQPLNLEQIIQDRILKGIKNFFMAMKESFEQYSGENGIESLDTIPSIAIFLGGNSSKSERVKRLFGQVLGLERDCRLYTSRGVEETGNYYGKDYYRYDDGRYHSSVPAGC